MKSEIIKWSIAALIVVSQLNMMAEINMYSALFAERLMSIIIENLGRQMKMADDKIKKSLKCSILDGTFYSIMIGSGESFFFAFAVFLKANNIQLGLLGSLS